MTIYLWGGISYGGIDGDGISGAGVNEGRVQGEGGDSSRGFGVVLHAS